MRAVLLRIFICVGACGTFLYSYVDKQNGVTKRRLDIPVLAKEIKDIKEENTHLRYEIEIFESPEHLMELARHSEFSHLKHPMLKEVLSMQEGLALQISPEEAEEEKPGSRPQVKFPIGAK